MRYRALTALADYTFGQGPAEFLIDVPAAVGQAILTRLRLATGEWFLNLAEGTPYEESILGFHTQQLYDQVLKTRIAETPGVLTIDTYESTLGQDRALSVSATVTTIYGPVSLSANVYIPGAIGELDSTFILDQSALY